MSDLEVIATEESTGKSLDITFDDSGVNVFKLGFTPENPGNVKLVTKLRGKEIGKPLNIQISPEPSVTIEEDSIPKTVIAQIPTKFKISTNIANEALATELDLNITSDVDGKLDWTYDEKDGTIEFLPMSKGVVNISCGVKGLEECKSLSFLRNLIFRNFLFHEIPLFLRSQKIDNI